MKQVLMDILNQHTDVTMNKIWTIWKYALGGFSDDKTEPYDDYVALLRTVIVGVNFATCFFIIANVIHNW